MKKGPQKKHGGLKKQFCSSWKAIDVDNHIYNLANSDVSKQENVKGRRKFKKKVKKSAS